ncbi:MAG: endonuclease/exonuclease/phosphatase family protein, partial [Clostridia bacterium]|nr:endonuclease/exonuclease/phosphatase family protein [Clostridia bacterium]
NVASGRCYENCDGTKGEKAYNDITECAKIIKGENPVFCGINEINVFDDGRENASQPEHLASLTGLENSFFGKALYLKVGANRHYGNAVLSSVPILESKVIPIPNPEIMDESAYYEERSITKVKLDIAGGITVFQTHFGLAISEHQNAVLALAKAIDETEGPIVLMGDFNIRPSDLLHKILRERLNDTADILGDTYLKTFPSYKHETYPDCKIDYIYVSDHFKTLSLQTLPTKASDHLPLIAEVEL